MGDFIQPDDLVALIPGADIAKVTATIEDAEALARFHAPGIGSAAFLANPEKVATLKAILRKAITYDIETSGGRIQTQAAGPFSETTDTRQPRSSTLFSPQQVEMLKALTKGTVAVSGVYTLSLGMPDTQPRY